MRTSLAQCSRAREGHPAPGGRDWVGSGPASTATAKMGPGLEQTVPGGPQDPSRPVSCPTTTAPPPYPSASASPLCLPSPLLCPDSLSPSSCLSLEIPSPPCSWTCAHTHTKHRLRLTDARQLDPHKPILWRYTVRPWLSRRPGAAWREAAPWLAVSPERSQPLPCACVAEASTRAF